MASVFLLDDVCKTQLSEPRFDVKPHQLKPHQFEEWATIARRKLDGLLGRERVDKHISDCFPTSFKLNTDQFTDPPQTSYRSVTD